jgi:hypothetical protein
MRLRRFDGEVAEVNGEGVGVFGRTTNGAAPKGSGAVEDEGG